MKNIVVFLLIAAVVYWATNLESDIDLLMKSGETAEVVSNSGLHKIDTEPGSEVNVDDLAEFGVPTVIYGYMKSCDACGPVDRAVKRLLTYRPDVSVKRLEIVYGQGLEFVSQGEYLNSNFAPFIVIFDDQGKMVISDSGNGKDVRERMKGYYFLFDWMNAEGKRHFKKNNG